jgi:RNA polymerase sigma-70 factor (ECF subfamily)
MEDALSDADAVRQSLREPARFALVYDRYVVAVHAYLRRRVGDEIAEDLTAEAFVRAFRGRTRYRAQHETALPWLLGIASNLIGDHRRAERRRLAMLERLARDTPAADPQRETPGLSPELVRALRRLPAADRDALLLVAWGELSYEETACALAVPIGTVRSRIARARSRLSAIEDLIAAPVAFPAITQGEHHA